MRKFLWWIFGILCIAVVLLGQAAASSLGLTIASVTGDSGGIMVHMVPTFAQHLKVGTAVGGNATPGTDWTLPAAPPAAPAPRHPHQQQHPRQGTQGAVAPARGGQ
jgi:hypothetical protein